MNIAELPKVELHLHHEGAAPPDFVRQLAHEKKLDLSKIFDDQGQYAFDGFLQFLRCYEAATSVLQTPEDFGRLTTAILEQCAANGVVYAESFISPDFCGGGDLTAWREYLHAMQEAAQAAEARHGIIWRGIVTCIRHEGPDAAKISATCAAETAGDWVVGFGMGGDENQGHQGDFSYAYDMARESGLHLTTHAGEIRGPESVWEALRDLNVARIGHGVRSIEDPELVKELIARDVTLEVCPQSNVVLGVYGTLAAHPIHKLREAGVNVTVSTDDPPFFGSTMCKEYEALAKTFDWDLDVFTSINQGAAKAAFCDADTRARVLKKLENS